MTRYLIIGGALAMLAGASSYYGLGRTWGAPLALTGLTVLAVGFGLLSLDSSGAIRWTSLGVMSSGLALVAGVLTRTLGSDLPLSEGNLIAGLFILFAASMTLFGATGLVSDSIPVLAATALIVGAPLLAAGVWQERLGDLGFPLTIAGLLLVAAQLANPET